MPQSFIKESELTRRYGLASRTPESLRLRMANYAVPYSELEIEDVRTLKTKLFPAKMEIGKETSDRMRALCKFSELKLEESGNYRSHRKVVGPIVVAIKRLLFPFVKFHVSSAISTVREFQICAVEQLAAQEAELWKLKSDRNAG